MDRVEPSATPDKDEEIEIDDDEDDERGGWEEDEDEEALNGACKLRGN